MELCDAVLTIEVLWNATQRDVDLLKNELFPKKAMHRVNLQGLRARHRNRLSEIQIKFYIPELNTYPMYLFITPYVWVRHLPTVLVKTYDIIYFSDRYKLRREFYCVTYFVYFFRNDLVDLKRLVEV